MIDAEGTAGRVEPSERFEIEPPGRWVTGFGPAPPDAGEASADAPTDHLLIDRQLFPNKRSHYARHAQRLNTAQGVQILSQVSLDFDPAIERLVVHSVRVWRDGEATEHADAVGFKLIQRESNLERQLYDGRMSALLLLEDVRIGDVIDIASTRISDHPQLADHFHAVVNLSYPVPVQRWSTSVLVKEGSPLRWRMSPDEEEPATRELKGGWRLQRWTRHQLPAAEIENNAPGWHLQGSALEFTDFADWAEVAHWIAELWGKTEAPEALKDIARDIIRESEDEVVRADRALAFVRDEIRYLGLEDGIGSLQPCPVADVMRRRFGDCKDKSRLLCMLLRMMRIPASPMLVNTIVGKAVQEMLPSPGAFDHVIVCARIDGKSIWIDPTRRSLAETVLELPPPNFGYALQVSPKAKGLKGIPATPPDAALLVVKETFSITGPDQPVELDVEQTASGYEAEHLRELFGSLGSAKVREWREAQVREVYPQSRATGDWSNDVSEESVTVTAHERFEIDEFALKGGEGSRAAPFGPSSLRGRFPGLPDEKERHSPWALPYPCRIRHEVHFDLPFQLPAESDLKVVDSETFGFKSQLDINGDRLTAVYRYWSKADHVGCDQLETFRRDVDAMSKASNHMLHFPFSHDVWKRSSKGKAAPVEKSARDEGAEDDATPRPHRRHHQHDRHRAAQRKKTIRIAGTVVVVLIVVGIFTAVMIQDQKSRPPKPASSAPDMPGGFGAVVPLTSGPANPSLPTATSNGATDAGDDGFNPLFAPGQLEETPAFNGSLLDDPQPSEGEKSDIDEKYPSLELKF